MFFSPRHIDFTIPGKLNDDGVVAVQDASAIAALVVWEQRTASPENQHKMIELEVFHAEASATMDDLSTNVWKFEHLRVQGQLHVYRLRFAGTDFSKRIATGNATEADKSLQRFIELEQSIELVVRDSNRKKDPRAVTCLTLQLGYSIRRPAIEPRDLPRGNPLGMPRSAV